MRTDKHRPVTMPERSRMRALRAERLSYAAIGAKVGRSATCVMRHVRDVPKLPLRDKQQRRVRRLTRMERFIASLNRAIAEAQP